MAKNTTPVSNVRDIKTAVDRTQQYIKLLTTRKNGITAGDLRDAVGAITKHNSWSLERFGAKYGFTLVTERNEGEALMRYRFVPMTTKTAPALKAAAAAIAVPAKKTAAKIVAKKPIIVIAKKPAKKSAAKKTA